MKRCGLCIILFLSSAGQVFASESSWLDKAEALYQSKDYEQAAEVFSQALANTDDAR